MVLDDDEEEEDEDNEDDESDEESITVRGSREVSIRYVTPELL